MIDMSHTPFQALSACEAMDVKDRVGELILTAYQSGMNVIAENMDSPIEELTRAHQQALNDLGFRDITASESMLAISLKKVVEREKGT